MQIIWRAGILNTMDGKSRIVFDWVALKKGITKEDLKFAEEIRQEIKKGFLAQYMTKCT